MQGRPDSGGDSRDQSGSRYAASLNGTGKGSATPRRSSVTPRAGRSPAKPHVSSPPAVPRTARPRRKAQRPLRKRLVFFGCIMVFGLLVLCGIITSANFINALNASSGPATTAARFLGSLSSREYAEAYKDLGPDITNTLQLDQFIREAQAADDRYGVIKSYSEVEGSATSQDNTQSFTYSITRTQQSTPGYRNPYEVRITLQSEANGNTWKIKEYSDALFTPPSLVYRW